MAITSVSVAKFNLSNQFQDIDEIKSRLIRFNYSRDENGLSLTSAINLNLTTDIINSEINALSGIVFDEFIHHKSRVIQNPNAIDYQDMYIVDNSLSQGVRSGTFSILNNGIIVTNTKLSRSFISNTIKAALHTEIKPISIDILRLSEDYPNNWIGGITDREGNWQSGTLYGNDLRNDDCIGSEFVTCNKKQVGSYTESFGNGPIKFKASEEGCIAVYTKLETGILPLLKFINDEISPYFVNPHFTNMQ